MAGSTFLVDPAGKMENRWRAHALWLHSISPKLLDTQLE